MIRVGDKLMFSTKAMNDMYGHGEPVEIIEVGGPRSMFGNNYVVAKVWEPFLYYNQAPFQRDQMFHESHFLPAGCAIPGPTWFERLLDKVFA